MLGLITPGTHARFGNVEVYQTLQGVWLLVDATTDAPFEQMDAEWNRAVDYAWSRGLKLASGDSELETFTFGDGEEAEVWELVEREPEAPEAMIPGEVKAA